MALKQINVATRLFATNTAEFFIEPAAQFAAAVETFNPSLPQLYQSDLPPNILPTKVHRLGDLVPHGMRRRSPVLKYQDSPTIQAVNASYFQVASFDPDQLPPTWWFAEPQTIAPVINWMTTPLAGDLYGSITPIAYATGSPRMQTIGDGRVYVQWLAISVPDDPWLDPVLVTIAVPGTYAFCAALPIAGYAAFPTATFTLNIGGAHHFNLDLKKPLLPVVSNAGWVGIVHRLDVGNDAPYVRVSVTGIPSSYTPVFSGVFPVFWLVSLGR